MHTLYDIGRAVMDIREAVDQIEVRGRRNAAYVTYAVDLCNKVIKSINEAARAGQNEGLDQQKEGEKDGHAD